MSATKEQAFKNGAAAMQGRIVAWLMMQSLFDLAPKILSLPIPEYSEPELTSVTSESGQVIAMAVHTKKEHPE